jgi:hypothetical protein
MPQLACHIGFKRGCEGEEKKIVMADSISL